MTEQIKIIIIAQPKMNLQYCAKVMQTNFDEFPGFSGLFDENSLETNFRRYFATPIVSTLRIFERKFAAARPVRKFVA